MALADLAGGVRLVQAFPPATITAGGGETLSTAIDTTGYYEGLLVLDLGTTAASANGVFALHTATTTGGSYSAITAATFTTITDSDDDKMVVGRVLCNDQNKFWKIAHTVTGGNLTCGLSVLLLPYDSGNSNNTAMDFTT